MTTYLQLTGIAAIAGNVIDLNGTNTGQASIWLESGWVPKIARRKDSPLGGQVYEDTVESIPLRIEGSSVTQCLTMLHYLSAALDQAGVWRKGGNVTAVLLHYRVNGSALTTPLQAAVLGAPSGRSDNLLQLQPRFNEMVGGYVIQLRLPLVRRGIWLGDEETATATATDNGVLMSGTFASVADIPSPVKLELTNFNATANFVGFLFAGNSSLQKIEGESFDGGSATSAFSEVATNASGGSLCKLSVTTLLFTATASYTGLTTAQSDALRDCFIILPIENNAVAAFDVTVSVRYVNSSVSQTKRVQASTGLQFISFGPFTVDSDIGVRGITVSANSEPNGNYDIKYDYLAIIGNQGGRIIGVKTAYGSSSANWAFVLDDRSLARPFPAVSTNGGGNSPVSYEGLATLHFSGDTISAMLMISDSAYSDWRYMSGVTVVSCAMTATRRKAYLVPQ